MKGVEPIQKEFKTRQEIAAAEKRIDGRISHAEKSWPGFTKHKAGIAAKIEEATQRGEFLDLHDAYIQVVFPTLTADEATVRAKVVAEMNAASQGASRSVPAAGSAKVQPVKAGGDVDAVEAAIRNSIAALK
jgi:hypothetical protein